jgi:putative endonuclease
MMKTFFVYILASHRHGTLYIGMTSNLEKRLAQHREGVFDGFTKKYHIYQLVYFEMTDNPASACERERRLKCWKRQWKIRLIETANPTWKNLSEGSLPSQG